MLPVVLSVQTPSTGTAVAGAAGAVVVDDQGAAVLLPNDVAGCGITVSSMESMTSLPVFGSRL
jgi:hypothetical protein